MVNSAILLGKNDCHIDFSHAEAPLHQEVVASFFKLQGLAHDAGFDLAIASSYRDYNRQLGIWNAKLDGSRPVFDSDSQLIAMATLSPWQQVEAVLRWSALPGASRHHWGCDIDVYDRSAVAPGYQVQLSPEEAAEDGPFAAMHNWLDEVLLQQPELGFFRPYDSDRGGVAPERWHLSYAPVAAVYQQSLNVDILKQCCEASEMLLKDTVLLNLEAIYHRFVQLPSTFYPHCYRRLFD